MTTADPRLALDFLARAAQRVIPLSDVEQYNAAVNAVRECVDFKAAQDAIAKAKSDAPADAPQG